MGMYRSAFVFLFLLSTAFTIFTAPRAAVLTVGSGQDYQTIQAAIDAALPEGDEIIVRPGTYRENIDFRGKNILLKSSSGPEQTIIDGGGSASAITVRYGEHGQAGIEGFTITNGIGTKVEELEYGFGGGILCIGSSPLIYNNIIENNRADNATGLYGLGGGICAYEGAAPVIDSNIIRSNSAELGGAIFIQSKTTESRETAAAQPEVKNNLMYGNSAMKGAALFIHGISSPAVINNTIADNSAQAEGGGIWIDRTHSSPLIVNTLLWGNGDELFGSRESMILYCNTEDGDYAGQSGNISADPRMDSTYHLNVGSPCIDAGSDDNASSQDIDGDFRPADGNNDGQAAVDIGADEYTPKP